jgi:hypothetical protein
VRAFLAIIASAVVLAGCAAHRMHWTKTGATQEAFMQDRNACLQHTPKDREGVYNASAFRSCMTARGYQQDPKGDLSAPTGTEPNPLQAVEWALRRRTEL